MKIIVRMPNWIGDFVMATPILEDLRAFHNDAKIDVLCDEKFKDLLENNPYINEVIGFSRKERFFPKGVISKLRKEGYDLGILLTNSFSSAFHFFMGRVKKRVGFFKLSRAFLLNHNVFFPKDKEKRHLVTTYKELIDSSSNSEPKLFIVPHEKKVGITRFGINPGAAYGSAKCYPPDRFRRVVEALLCDFPNCEVVVFGDKFSKPIVDQICEGFDKRVINLAAKTTIKELVKEIGALDAFLTNDSGPMHIAASLKVPLVAIFGSTNPIITGPYKWGKVVYKGVSCSPCYKRECPIDFKCMNEIEALELVQEMKRALLTDALFQREKKVSYEDAVEAKIKPGHINKKKAVGVIILGGGMGRRLGFNGPKGCVEVQGRTLFEILLNKVEGKCAIMTSRATHDATKDFLEEKGYLNVDLFEQRSLPRLSAHFEESPEGNGALFSAFYGSSVYEKWKDVDEIRVIPIDNPLAEPLPLGDVELSVLSIKKEKGEDNLGILLEIDGALHVCEYSEIPDEFKDVWSLAYSGIFSCSKSFFEKAAKSTLPWHKVKRNGVKHFEKFVFDAFPLAKSYNIYFKDRKTSFAPIKTKENLLQFNP